jgi:predicted nucleic acid-binding protein
MNDKAFLDTNILIYLYSNDDLWKKQIVSEIVTNTNEIVISTQVLTEFSNIGFRKLNLSSLEVAITLDELIANCEINTNSFRTIKQAISVKEKYRYSWFDSLIISAALESKCTTLYSEDMHHQQLIESSLIIVNPFYVKPL